MSPWSLAEGQGGGRRGGRAGCNITLATHGFLQFNKSQLEVTFFFLQLGDLVPQGVDPSAIWGTLAERYTGHDITVCTSMPLVTTITGNLKQYCINMILNCQISYQCTHLPRLHPTNLQRLSLAKKQNCHHTCTLCTSYTSYMLIYSMYHVYITCIITFIRPAKVRSSNVQYPHDQINKYL